MKISQYIRHLKQIQKEHRVLAHPPALDHRSILKNKKETVPRFYSYFEKVKGDEEGRLGEKVCRV